MPSLIDYPAADTCLLYLVRHGATPHNQSSPPRLQGNAVDESLSALGRKQAGRVARLLARRPIADVFASPMRRAVETAEIIAAKHELKVDTFATLKEVDVGEWEGRTWDEIKEQYPQAYADFVSNPADCGYPGGESIGSVIDRTHKTLGGMMHNRLGEEIVVVAHSVVIRTYLGALIGMLPNKRFNIPQQNCAVNIVRWKDGFAKAVSINAVGHLM